jgi:hypothetical protein
MWRDLSSGCSVMWRIGNSHRLKISNRFAVLENLNKSEDINRACGNTKTEYQNLS